MDLQPKKKWECSKCSKTFKRKQHFTHHVITHDPDAKVKCEICRKISKNPVALSLHMRRLHSNRKRPSCDICRRVFHDSVKLRSHTEAIHSTSERPRLPCGFPGCKKTFVNKYEVSRHVKTEHAKNPARFWCILCGNEFKTRSELKQHISTHTTEKPYNCATCGRSFAQKGTMKRHERTHFEKSTRVVSQCPVCPKTCSNKDNLQHHVRIVHENQRNYPCTFCDKRFSTASHLRRHVEAMHVVNKKWIHSCDKCEYKSHAKASLATHKIRHNAARHGCYFCGKKFFLFYELVRHCRAHTLEKLNLLLI